MNKMLNQMENRMKNNDGFAEILGLLALISLFVLFFLLLASIDEENRESNEKLISKKENEHISEYFDGRIIENISKNEVEGINWNRKVEFVDKEIVYVNVLCEVSNEEEIESSEEHIEREYECKLKEIKNDKENKGDNNED